MDEEYFGTGKRSIHIIYLVGSGVFENEFGQPSEQHRAALIMDCDCQTPIKDLIGDNRILEYFEMENGVVERWILRYYNDGKPKEHTSMRSGLPHGDVIWWHENGQMEYMGVWDDGNPVGNHIWWNPNGEKIFEHRYQN